MVDLADYHLESLRPGTRLRTATDRQVVVGAPLGGGNEGLVLRGECDGGAVAVKVLRPDRTGTRAARTRALVSKAVSTRIDPRIAAPFDIFEYEARVGHVSPLVPGIDVADLAERPAVLNPRQRLLAVLRLGGLLARLHRHAMAFGDLNKGAVKVCAAGDADAEVFLVDLDSAVMRGAPLPLTLGAPDTAAVELRRGEQPSTVEGWQACDWTAFGHIAVDLLLNKTAACGIDDAEAQVNAFMGMPPFLVETSEGARIDRAAGLPKATLGPGLCRLLGRLFDPRPTARDGTALVNALASEVINNHQIQCGSCHGASLVHAGATSCPLCSGRLCPPLRMNLFGGRTISLDRDLNVTRELLGGAKYVSRLHARVFRIGAITFVCSLTDTSQTRLIRDGVPMVLSRGIHVPLLPGDRLRFGSAVFVEVLVTTQ